MILQGFEVTDDGGMHFLDVCYMGKCRRRRFEVLRKGLGVLKEASLMNLDFVKRECGMRNTRFQLERSIR